MPTNKPKTLQMRKTEVQDLFINDSPRYATFTYMGMPGWAYNTNLKALDLLTVSKICYDCNKIVHLHLPISCGYETVDWMEKMVQANTMLFQNCMEFRFTRAMYDVAVVKWPVKVKFSYRHRTGPHATYEIELLSQDTEEHLVTWLECFSFVNLTTRRLSTGPPKFFSDEMDGKALKSDGLRVPRLPQRPQDAYTRKALVLISDCDMNNHANFNMYLAKCQETLWYALTAKVVQSNQASDKQEQTQKQEEGQGQGTSADDNCDNSSRLSFGGRNNNSMTGTSDSCCKGITQPRWLTLDVVKHGVKTARLRFVREALVGEYVNIYLWQDEDKPLWVFFTIENERSSIIFEMSLEYFGPTAKLYGNDGDSCDINGRNNDDGDGDKNAYDSNNNGNDRYNCDINDVNNDDSDGDKNVYDSNNNGNDKYDCDINYVNNDDGDDNDKNVYDSNNNSNDGITVTYDGNNNGVRLLLVFQAFLVPTVSSNRDILKKLRPNSTATEALALYGNDGGGVGYSGSESDDDDNG
ncbi:hypothetical protein PoB_000990600 [Plakobranchus ocellatus]|uniref:F5/8 type C domain-containing protein n=1 Tax=Plakobranchus ocellatus TaxID=259542 RepID=A0AAV3YJG5_9GAST|nr:hypothetical protein PoB_000990600 [Plakobranchus ocellatus]